jgi:DNA-binding transcriptional LysR family regulator
VSLDVHPQLLRALSTVIDAGSFTAAAERLGYTQSALSKQISTLEDAAGTPLVLRRSRGVAPTEAGRRLALRAAAVLDQLDAADRELRVEAQPVEGTVALGGFPTTAMQLIPSAIAQLKVLHPWVHVEFLESSSPVQLRRLRAGRLDLGIIATGDDLPDYVTAGLKTEGLPAGDLLVAVSERHELAERTRVTPSDLRNEPWIAGQGAPGDPQFGPWPTLPNPRIAARLNGWSARFGFVSAGIGITTVPTLIKAVVPRGITTLDVDDPAIARRSMLLAHVGTPTPAASAVRDALIRAAERIAFPIRARVDTVSG